MSNKRLNNVLDRQQRHLFRDALAVLVLAVGLGIAALMVAFQVPSMAPLQPVAEEPTFVVENLSPAQATAKQLAERHDVL